jgi:hypothetical protein
VECPSAGLTASREGGTGDQDRARNTTAELVSPFLSSPSSSRPGDVRVVVSQKHQADRQHRKLNTSPSTVEDKDVLKKPLCEPMVRKVDLHFPLGLEVTARNLKGVTIKDALDAIHKQFKKKVCTLQSHPSICDAMFSSSTAIIVLHARLTRHLRRLMTSWTSHTSQASSGTKKNATPDSSYTRRQQAPPKAPSPRRRRVAPRNRHLVYIPIITPVSRTC